MKVKVVYRLESDHARDVMTFLGDFKRFSGYEIEEVDPDTRDGAHLCRTYDIVEYPTLIAIDNSGSLQNLWRGLPMPTINEVSYYASQD